MTGLAVLEGSEKEEALICECEIVTRWQLEESLRQQPSSVLSDLRRDLRLGMGPCQGTYCATRAASIAREVKQLPIEVGECCFA